MKATSSKELQIESKANNSTSKASRDALTQLPKSDTSTFFIGDTGTIENSLRHESEKLKRFFEDHQESTQVIYEDPTMFRVQIETAVNSKVRSIYINSFEPFRNDVERLNILKGFSSELDFIFLDFPQLQKSNIEGAIRILEYQSKSRSAKIKVKLDQKVKDGYKLGNPHIGDSRGKAIRKRKYNALLDPAMKSLRKEAKKLQDAGWSLNKIAQYFTEQGVKSPRGGSFHAKTIDRLLEQWKELETRWLPKRTRNFAGLNNFITGTLFLDGENPPIPESEVPLNREDLNELIEDKLLLHFTEPLKFNIKVFIHDNSEEQEPLYSDIIEKGESSFSIDLEEQILLPGIHYLSLVAENKAYLPIEGLELQFYPSLIETKG